MTNLERLPDESLLQFHRRIICGKLVDKTLSDIDYSELSEIAYGKIYSSDVARRMFYGSLRTLQIIDDEQYPVTSNFSGISTDKDIELQKEKQRYFDQRREFNKIVNASAREEHLFDRLATAAEDLSNTVGTFINTKAPFTMETGVSEAVLVLSDWHYGLVANNIFNTYNTDICKQRVKQILKKTSQRLILHRCSKLHVVVLGDLIHGAIHTSARVASEELACDQLMQASEILAQSIEALSRIVPEIVVYTTYGNHARAIPDKKANIHRDNFERIIPWWLRERLNRYKKITVQPESETEFILLNVCGYDICAVHGDNDSVKTSPRLLTTLLQKTYNKDIKYILLGDKHHRESFDEIGVSALLCGSLCGTDDYANSKRLFSTPSQLLLVFTPSEGVDAEYRLSC